MKQGPATLGKDTPGSGQDAPETPAAASDSSKVSDKPGKMAANPPAPASGGDGIKTRRQHIIVYTIGAALAGLLAAWCLAVPMPTYLLYATPLIKSDAAVLFLGPGEAARRQQVDELVAKGWVKFVIIPWKGEIFEARVAKALVTPQKTARLARALRMDFNKSFVERTHVEVIQALELMKHIGAKRAIFVSSPYHMRRIALMAERVFDAGTYDIAYLPTAYDPPQWPWFAHWKDVKWVVSEWVKIVWFLLYSPFM